jgi:hypothetical protein
MPLGTTVNVPSDVVEPKEFDAVTVNEYEFPFPRPVTANGEEAPDAVRPPGFEVAV